MNGPVQQVRPRIPPMPVTTPVEQAPAAQNGLDRFLLGLLVAQVAILGLSAFAHGFYELALWGAMALVSACILVAAAVAGNLRFDRLGCVAAGSLTALVAWSGLSLAWAGEVDRGWEDANRLGLYAIVLLTALIAARSATAARAALLAFAAATCALGAYVLARLLAGSGAELFVASRLSHPVGYINGEAAFLGAGAWVWLTLAASWRRPELRASAASVTVLLLGLGVLTQSRGAVIAWVLAAACMVALLPGRDRRLWVLLTAAAGTCAALPWLLDVYAQRDPEDLTTAPADGLLTTAGLALFAAAVATGALYGSGIWLTRRLDPPMRRRLSRGTLALAAAAAVAVGASVIGNPAERVSESWSQFTSLRSDQGDAQRFTTAGGYRYDYWRVAVRAFADSPLTGIGGGDYPARYLRERRNPDYVLHAHSLPLQTVAELGVPGGLLLAALVGSVLWALVRLRRARDPMRLQVAAAGGGLFLAWVFQANIDWLWSFPGITGMALIAGALLIQTASGVPRPAPQAGSTVAVLAMLLAAVVSASVGLQWLADRYRDRAEELTAADPRAAIVNADRSLTLNPAALDAYYAKSAAFARLGDYDSARAVLRIAARRAPDSYVTWTLLGDLAVRRGDRPQARADYGRASRLNPFDEKLERLATDGR